MFSESCNAKLLRANGHIETICNDVILTYNSFQKLARAPIGSVPFHSVPGFSTRKQTSNISQRSCG